jgi:hypothetical protein
MKRISSQMESLSEIRFGSVVLLFRIAGIPLKNAVCFMILTYLLPELFTFYTQGALKLKK